MAVQRAIGTRSAIVSSNTQATEAAREVLNRSGTVVDAAITGAAVLTVALPHACGLGGDCFILVHVDGRTKCLNGSGPAPAGLPAQVSDEQLARGPLSCSVPGMLGAWEALHRQYGEKPWPELIAPAIEHARVGMPVAGDLAQAMRDNIQALQRDDGCASLFLDGNQPRRSGSTLLQPVLGETLEAVSRNGAAALYGGAIGDSLCRTIGSLGGALALEDLRAYSPTWSDPLEYEYRGHTVRVAPPNSYGIAMLLQLAALANVDPSAFPVNSVDRFRILMLAARCAFHRARDIVVDPQSAGDRPQDALAPEAVEAIQAELRDAGAGTSPDEPPRARGTATISVADRDGNGVSIVQSIFAPFGSWIADASTGIVLNNRMMGFSVDPDHPNNVAPGKRPAHTLSPSMTFRNERLRFVLSTPGGSGQTITLTQILTNMVDHGLELAPAISEFRWSMDIQGNYVLEPEIDESVLRRLTDAGLNVRHAAPDQRFFFGSAECIAIDDSGSIEAVADFRRDAAAAAE